MTQQPLRAARGAFTLVELLVVIAIIGVLVALLLPAIQAARESARRSQCLNHLKQLGLASLNAESAQKGLPSGGWGYRWLGDPDQGYGESQPGSWAFMILPYMEGANVHTIAKGLTSTAKLTALVKLKTTVIPDFYCPTRRPAVLSWGPETSINCTALTNYVAKTDYAGNGGSNSTEDPDGSIPANPAVGSLSGPPAHTCPDTYPNCNFACAVKGNIGAFDGAIAPRFPVELNQITDGTSSTVLYAEKYLQNKFVDDSTTVNSCADNNSLWSGWDWDVIRWMTTRPGAVAARYAPRADSDTTGNDCAMNFGGPHTSGFNAVNCDGSVQTFNLDVDPKVFELACRRNDDGRAWGP